MILTTVDKTQPYTVIMVSEPVRLNCLGNAGLGRGVYFLPGDMRGKFASTDDRRLLSLGLVGLTFVAEKADKGSSEQGSAASAYKENVPAVTIINSSPIEPDIQVAAQEGPRQVVTEEVDELVVVGVCTPYTDTGVAIEVAATKLATYEQDCINTSEAAVQEPVAQDSSAPKTRRRNKDRRPALA